MYVENLVLQGSGNSWATGNMLPNMIVGNSGANVLDGGGANDILTGGAGNDTFVIHRGDGSDTITDFHPVAIPSEVVVLDGFGFAGFGAVKAAMHQVGSNVALDLNNGDTLTFKNVTVDS